MTKFIEKPTAITPNRELQSDEYFNETDHLIYCSKCNTPRQCRHELQGKVLIPSIRCKCQQEIFEQEEVQRKLHEKQMEIEHLKTSGLQDKALYDYLNVEDPDVFSKVQINHNRFLGYTKDADGNLVIDPEQAETVKRIYREYLEGLSMDKIAAGLERDGILTGAGGKKWHTSTINKILRNEKYIDDALLQKTYTTDFLNKTRVKNNGLVPQSYVEGDHEAIIPKDIYLQVQEELVRRRVVKTSANGKKRSYSCNHCFSQIVICGECGEMFRRLHWNNRGVKSIVWRCISRLESTGLECHARTINDLVLQDAVLKYFKTKS